LLIIINYINYIRFHFQVADTRNVITRDGRALTCRSFEVTDGSIDNTISLMLWDKDWVERSAFWEAKRTVLFLVDARITYDEYRKKTALNICTFPLHNRAELRAKSLRL